MDQPPPFDQLVTFLYAVDTAASRAFYGEVLRLPLALDQGGCAIYAVAGMRGFLGICPARGPREVSDPRREGGAIVTLVTPAVEAWHAWLAAAGVAIEAPPARHAGIGITHFFFRDPAGYLLEIQRFEDPRWPAPG
jgi:catechol 2,3-dioxygenase-like lactoylglutathione lyase family enzyme